MNNGGFFSPYWALLALVALIYVVRFGRTLLEYIGGLLVFIGAIAVTQHLQMADWLALLNILIGVGLIITLIVEVAVLLVGREREAITGTFEMELNAVRRMVNTIQHEIYNPLAAAKGNVDLIRQHEVPDAFAGNLDSLDQALRTIETVVQRLQRLERERLVRGIGNLEVYSLPDAPPETP
jgi:signal transduction histidine kinase